MRTTLRALEGLLLYRGQRTARHNAWASVVEDRRRAHSRRETQRLLEATGTRRAGREHPA
ncbi:hypothetical protein [Streptomyces sp. NPDC005438]|uniref:hypothetical protein n=1 Tax=Streptomyces sp. NPDC005438 TaxID=3156880 RepID=UPI0033A1BC47